MSMKITAQTTDEQILAPVLAARKALAKASMDPKKNDSGSLASYLNRIAFTEGAARARGMYRDGLIHSEGDHDAAMKAVMDLVLNGADDTWSGRKNDLARVHFDGLLQAAKDLRWNQALG